MSSKEKIKNYEKERALIFETLLDAKAMIPGSYKQLLLRCGKSNCWCHHVEGGGHPLRRITWTENGISKTKAIPKKDTNWIKEVTDEYRNFRKMRRKLKKLEAKCKQLLDKYEKELIKKTRQLKDYL